MAVSTKAGHRQQAWPESGIYPKVQKPILRIFSYIMPAFQGHHYPVDTVKGILQEWEISLTDRPAGLLLSNSMIDKALSSPGTLYFGSILEVIFEI